MRRAFAGFSSLAMALTLILQPQPALAQQSEELQPIEIVYRDCYERTRYIYDGFNVYPAGTERVCHYLLSNGQVITVVGGYSEA